MSTFRLNMQKSGLLIKFVTLSARKLTGRKHSYLPAVMPGSSSIPQCHVARFSSRQFVSTARLPLGGVLSFHTFLVIPFVLEVIGAFLGGFVIKVNLDLTVSLAAFSAFTILDKSLA